MKKWLTILFSSLLLLACNDEQATTPAVTEVNEPNEDVQAVLDLTEDDKFASLIYSVSAESYLLLHAQGDVTIVAEEKGNDLQLHITHTKDEAAQIRDVVYELQLAKAYDRIHLFENGQEIPFESWTE